MLLRRNTIYKSDIDKFLDKFNQTCPKSRAQQAEIDKYKRISELRDNPQPQTETETVWENF